MKKKKYLIAVIGIVLVVSLIICFFVCKYLFYDVDIVFCEVEWSLMPSDKDLRLSDKDACGFSILDNIEWAQKNNGDDKEFITAKELEKILANKWWKLKIPLSRPIKNSTDKTFRRIFDKTIKVYYDERFDVYLAGFSFIAKSDIEGSSRQVMIGVIDCYDGEVIQVDGPLIVERYNP